MTSESDEDVAGLKAKRDELLRANAALKAQMKEQAERLASLEAASAAAEEERAKKAGNFEKLAADLQAKHAAEQKLALERISQYEQKFRLSAIDSSVNSALNAANVSPKFRDLAAAFIKSQPIEVGDDGATVSIGGKSLADYVTAWTQSEAGKHVVLSGSTGGASPATAAGPPIGNPNSLTARLAAYNAAQSG